MALILRNRPELSCLTCMSETIQTDHHQTDHRRAWCMDRLRCRSTCNDAEFEALVQRNLGANAGLNFAGGVLHLHKPLLALRQWRLICIEASHAWSLHIPFLKLAV